MCYNSYILQLFKGGISMGKIKMGCLGVFIVFILLAVVGACIGPDAGKTSNSKTPEKAEKQVPEYTCDVEGVGKVKGVVSSNVGIAIYDIEERDVIGGQFHSEQAQGKFVIVSVVVSNGQKDAITVDANSFKLVTADGVEYSHSTEAQTALAMENGGKMDSFLKKINPDMTVSTKIPFDIPKNKNLSDLKLEARGGFAGEKVLLPVTVQKAE